ncbi:aspartyl/glutamyl-tRNA(Asn/Gln) amidotransferase subunit C [Sporomusaceae bacterium FL31]|jgi:aspartyl-tRNA(Asn)/glutamyl-tRNA(Gln) amidotransferase subunit C|nr:aspartyl/glutamyl-tRNA(Asn/Gln) amidotransferase subunit C [Sporomusaceae bacterium FL31]GCE35464.1 aspartyl/glutamyl-tRNA(Asn/Gln) amidotransferase subunit C [Sporomusaceae bacterium]
MENTWKNYDSLDGDKMKITLKDVENVALLSRLEFPENELVKFTEQLNAFLEYADVLSQVDVEGIQPTAHVLPLKNVMRPDEAKPSLARELALSNAPEQENGYFKVPKIMEG